MYNGIGLSTPRGSGTSGYVSTNNARVSKQKSRLDFIKEMKALRANILPPPRKANKDILDHNQKRQIYVKLAEIREKLQTSDKSYTEEEIMAILKESEAKLIENFEKGNLNQDGNRDSHALAVAKEKQFSKVKNAFAIGENYEYGSAFDFEQQEKQRLERVYTKELKSIEQEKEKDKAKRDKKKARKEEKKKLKKEKKEKRRLESERKLLALELEEAEAKQESRSKSKSKKVKRKRSSSSVASKKSEAKKSKSASSDSVKRGRSREDDRKDAKKKSSSKDRSRKDRQRHKDRKDRRRRRDDSRSPSDDRRRRRKHKRSKRRRSSSSRSD